jgi:hypothetical protein
MIVSMSYLLRAGSKAAQVPPNKSFQRTASAAADL